MLSFPIGALNVLLLLIWFLFTYLNFLFSFAFIQETHQNSEDYNFAEIWSHINPLRLGGIELINVRINIIRKWEFGS